MGTLSVWHWLIVLAIVSLVFGTGKLRSLGSDLGLAIKGFKDGVKESGSLRDSIADQRSARSGREYQGCRARFG